MGEMGKRGGCSYPGRPGWPEGRRWRWRWWWPPSCRPPCPGLQGHLGVIPSSFTSQTTSWYFPPHSLVPHRSLHLLLTPRSSTTPRSALVARPVISRPAPVYRRPYRTIPHHTVPYCTIPYHTVPYRTIPYHTIPYRTVPYHTILYHKARTVQHAIISFTLHLSS